MTYVPQLNFSDFGICKSACGEPREALSEDDAIYKININLDSGFDEKSNLGCPSFDGEVDVSNDQLEPLEEVNISFHTFVLQVS